jgi:hypothetical protein
MKDNICYYEFIELKLGVLSFVWNSIIQGFANINWMSWDMWAAFGQIIGAAATLWTARVALGQMKEARRQNELAYRQIEEARKREEAALKAELLTKVRIVKKEEKNQLSIFLTNIKQVPVYIYQYHLLYCDISKDIINISTEVIETDAITSEVPEMVPFGDVCLTEIPVDILLDALKQRNSTKGLFKCLFHLTNGDVYQINILLEYSLTTFLYPNRLYWHLYVREGQLKAINEIREKKHLLISFNPIHCSYNPDPEDTQKLIY